MNARFLGKPLNFRCFTSLLRGISRSYATSEASTNGQITIPQDVLKNNTSRLLTTQVAHLVRIPPADTLLAKIISHYKASGYVQYEQCQHLMDAFEGEPNNELLIKENIQFLLHACGTQIPAQHAERRMHLFQRLWNLLKEKNLLTKEDYMEKLRVLQHNQLPLDDLKTFLNEMALISTEPVETPALFSELLNVACSSGNMENATEVLSAMRDRNFALTEQNFNALIMCNGRNHDLDGIKATLNSMEAADMLLTMETQSTLFTAYIECDEKEMAWDILKKYHGQFNEHQVLKMLHSGVRFGMESDMIKFLVRELPADYTSGPDLDFELRQLCNELLHNGKFDIVKTIVSAMPLPKFSENQSIDTYAASVLAELFRAELPETEIIQFAEVLRKSDKNSRALHVVTEIAMHRSPPSALGYLEALSISEPLRPHYFWPLIMYNFRRHGEIGILNALRHMRRLKTSCDNETLNIYVLPHMPTMLEDSVKAVGKLVDTGIKTSTLLTPLIRHLLGQQKIKESLQILEAYPVKIGSYDQLLHVLEQLSINVRATKRYQQFAKLLMELANHNENPKEDFIGEVLVNMLKKQERLQGDLHSFQRFLNEMRRIGIHISHGAFNGLEEILNNINSRTNEKKIDEQLFGGIQRMLQQMKDRNLILSQNCPIGGNANSSFIKHPRDMSLSELECHLIELESKNMNTRGALRRLLQLYVRDNCLERALEIKQKCDNLNVQESPGMVASIFDLYIKLGDLTKAEEYLERLRKTFPAFQLDEHKLIDYAALLVRENQLEMALKILNDRSAQHQINGGDYVVKNVWNLLNNVAQYAARQEPKLPKEKNLTFEIFEFLHKNGYCNTDNAVLGPIVREYLIRGDIKSAVSEFYKFAEKYKSTPLQFELLSILVRLCNKMPEEISRYPLHDGEAQVLLKDVTEIISKVYGTTNMNSALVLAFAESGTDSQLRRLLMNPEFRVNHELLQKNCTHLGKEGSVRTLLRLAKGARGLNRAIMEQTIYDLLLNNFIKSNDYAAAIDLFERMDADDDLKISTEFVKNLVNLLKVNKVEVPNNVALKAYINRVKV